MVVVDSSVLISLSRIGKLNLLKRYFQEIKITQEIYDEVEAGEIGSSEVEDACSEWITINKPKNTASIYKISKLEKIEKADASVILLAQENNEILISNDYALVMVARSKSVECWWITTFLLNCLNKKIITKDETKQILFELIKRGMRLSNLVYTEILKEIERM